MAGICALLNSTYMTPANLIPTIPNIPSTICASLGITFPPCLYCIGPHAGTMGPCQRCGPFTTFTKPPDTIPPTIHLPPTSPQPPPPLPQPPPPPPHPT